MKTIRTSTKLLILTLALLALVHPAAAKDYTVVILHPANQPDSDSAAYAAAGGQQAGNLYGANAAVWYGTAASAVNLHPESYAWSEAFGTSGTQQVGYGVIWLPTGRQQFHALLWSGTAASVVDLNPLGFDFSVAQGAAGNQQVGYGNFRNPVTGLSEGHALLWSGNAASAISLNPSGYRFSFAYGTSGTQQVGGAQHDASNSTHALLWFGTALSAVDLHPQGFTSSEARGTSGIRQVGSGTVINSVGGTEYRALLWSGRAESVVNLHPSGFQHSFAMAASSNQQVGYGAYGDAGNIGASDHALVWSGNASTCVDLHKFLPRGYVMSRAFGIDADGTIVGYAYYSNGRQHAIMWKPRRPNTN